MGAEPIHSWCGEALMHAWGIQEPARATDASVRVPFKVLHQPGDSICSCHLIFRALPQRGPWHVYCEGLAVTPNTQQALISDGDHVRRIGGICEDDFAA